MKKIKSLKRKRNEIQEPEEVKQNIPPLTRKSDDPLPKKVKWSNKQRVLVFASRGINHRDRHLMEDLKTLMPHHKPESKMERAKTLTVINEICEMKNCNNAIMFEGRKKQDLYMWISKVPKGPCAKFLVQNVHTMAELKLTGNCMRGSRPLLSFDPLFDSKPHYQLLKEVFVQVFGVPSYHPKSQPFFDHVYRFSILDNRIWFRNFQFLTEDGALAEIGPRFVLNPVKIFSGSFGGETLWENPHFISPSKYRQQLKKQANNKYMDHIQQKALAEATKPKTSYKLNPLDDIFSEDPLNKAEKIIKLENGDQMADEHDDTQEEEETPKKKKVKKNKLKKNKKQKFVSKKKNVK